jgi:hypothetical protein
MHRSKQSPVPDKQIHPLPIRKTTCNTDFLHTSLMGTAVLLLILCGRRFKNLVSMLPEGTDNPFRRAKRHEHFLAPVSIPAPIPSNFSSA